MSAKQSRISEYAAWGALASAVAVALGTVAPAQAQPGAVDEIVITGSRIVRRDFEANSPITTIEAGRLEESSTIAIESVVNQLPQFVPAASQFESDGDGTGGYMTGATRTPGASMVSLRGLGTNRNLVLLDGRRAVPVNGSMAVNINNIPAAAIQRIETITGGASSVYGADAIAGVVNFVLKRDFEGMAIDAQYGETQRGDGEEQRFSALFGSNFADGRGNVMIGIEHGKRGEMRGVDRSFYNEGFSDPTVATTGRILASGFAIPASNAPPQAVVDQVFADVAAPGQVTRTGTFLMNNDGTLFKTAAIASQRYNGPLVDENTGVVWRKYDVDGILRQNRAELTVQLPLTRFSLFGRGHMDLSDNVRVFGQGLVTDTTSAAFGTFNAHVGGWSATVPHGDEIYLPSVDANGNTLPQYLTGGLHRLNCPPVGGCTMSDAWPKPPEANMLLDARPDPNAPVQTYHNPVWQGQKWTRNDITSIQLLAGLEGNIPGTRDWTWEFYGSHGRTLTQATLYGNSRLYGFRWLVNQPNYGAGLNYIGNPEGNGFGAGEVNCTSGIPMFYGVPGTEWVEAYPYLNPTEGLVSDDCRALADVIVKSNSLMKQNVAEYNMQGGAFDLPGGEVRFAFGLSYRENAYEYLPDGLQTHSAIVDSVAGIYPVNPSFGKIAAEDVYGELLVPLVSGRPGMRDVSLELGYRHSSYDPAGSVDTYKTLLDWRFTDRVRFRGGRQVANRAPNVAELFQSEELQFLNSPYGEWCSRENPNNALSPNPNINPNAAQAEAICRAIMTPDGADMWFSEPRSAAATSGRWLNVIGNPNLNSEDATTITAGIVANIADRVTLSVDYWNIKITDMISAQDVDAVWIECMDPVTNPNFDPNIAPCQQLVRSRDPVSGGQGQYYVTFTNAAGVDTAGYDLQLDWAGQVGPGTLSVNFMASILDRMRSRTEADNWVDWTGSSGPGNITGVQGWSYDYRTFTTTSYMQGPWSATMRWRHLPSIKAAASVGNPLSTFRSTSSYDMFDVAGRYTHDGRWTVRFGIDNLFDKKPERTFPSDDTTAAGNTNAGFYDVLGRRFYLGFNYGF